MRLPAKKGGARGDGESLEGKSLGDFGRGERAGFQTAGVSAVSPHEDRRQVEKAKEKNKMEEEEFRGVFAESPEEVVER